MAAKRRKRGAGGMRVWERLEGPGNRRMVEHAALQA